MTENDDKPGSEMVNRVFDTAQCHVIDYVACNTDDEEASKTLIKNDSGGSGLERSKNIFLRNSNFYST